MIIRPYVAYKDFVYLQSWVDSERTHAFWCAGLIPYPLEDLHRRSRLKGTRIWRKHCTFDSAICVFANWCERGAVKCFW